MVSFLHPVVTGDNHVQGAGILVNFENSVTVTGLIHLPKGDMAGKNRNGVYLRFSLKHPSVGYDGVERVSFLPVRVFDPVLQEWLRGKGEGTPVRITGRVHSSSGSGEMFILAETLEENAE